LALPLGLSLALHVGVLASGIAAAAASQDHRGPAIVERTANDEVTIRAFRVDKPLKIDGRLDEEVYADVDSITDFHPAVANELRRDNGNILGNENFTFVIDTLHDGRNGYLFQRDYELVPKSRGRYRRPRARSTTARSRS
jgi:hypothetical protein